MGKETALQGSSQQAVATDSGGHVGRTSNSAKSVGRPDPALLLLEPLLQQGEAGPSTWKVKQVEAIRSQLSDAIRSNKVSTVNLEEAVELIADAEPVLGFCPIRRHLDSGPNSRPCECRVCTSR
jgi:hypothetical protein